MNVCANFNFNHKCTQLSQKQTECTQKHAIHWDLANHLATQPTVQPNNFQISHIYGRANV